jgi:hypothetical protein
MLFVQCMSVMARDAAAFSTVIVRHRVSPVARPMTGPSGRSSIPETSAIEPISRGVLDALAFAEHDGGGAGRQRRRLPPLFRDGPKDQTSDAQLRIGESLDFGFDAEPVIGPRFARTRWHRSGMTGSNGLRRWPSQRRRGRPSRRIAIAMLRRMKSGEFEPIGFMESIV